MTVRYWHLSITEAAISVMFECDQLHSDTSECMQEEWIQLELGMKR